MAKVPKHEEVILKKDPRAATYRMDIQGWVSRHGDYCGEYEMVARAKGCTHWTCSGDGCEEVTKKGTSFCPVCEEKRAQKWYDSLDKAEWGNGDPAYSVAYDVWFYDTDDAMDFCFEHELCLNDLRLLVTQPVEPRELEPWEFYDLPLDCDYDIPPQLQKLVDEFNQAVRDLPPLYYEYSDKAVDFSGWSVDPNEIIRE